MIQLREELRFSLEAGEAFLVLGEGTGSTLIATSRFSSESVALKTTPSGQLLTHSNHVGTPLDGELHFYSPGNDIASLTLDLMMHEGVVVDLSEAAGDYDVETSKMVGDRVELKEGGRGILHQANPGFRGRVTAR